MAEASIHPHPNMQINAVVTKDSRYTSSASLPRKASHAFTGQELFISITKTTSVATAGPADGLGFAKKPLSMIAEGLSYKAASRIASKNSKGTLYTTLRYRTIGFDGKPGPIKQVRHFINGSKIIPLDSSIMYRMSVTPPLAGVFELKILVKGYQSHWWAN